jgi:hypothetical protein
MAPAESLDESSAACVVVIGRRQRFVLHAIPSRADRRLGARSVRSRSGSEGAQNSQLGAQVKYG